MKRNVLLLLLAGIGVLRVHSSEHDPTTPTTQTEKRHAKLSVAEMEKKGEAGLGSFNVLNGENGFARQHRI